MAKAPASTLTAGTLSDPFHATVDPNEIHVSGRISWTDFAYDGTNEAQHTHPSRHVLVQILSRDAVLNDPWHLEGEDETDDNGYYEFSFEPALFQPSYDIRIEVYAHDGSAATVLGPDLVGTYYQWAEETDVSLGSATEIDYVAPNNTEHGKAFAIHDAAWSAHVLAVQAGGGSEGAVTINYPSGLEDSRAYYDDDTETINLGDHKWSSWDTVTHEFGHWFDHQHDITERPGGGHCFGNLAANGCNDEHGKDDGTRLAWSEGYADYFSLSSAQNDPTAPNVTGEVTAGSGTFTAETANYNYDSLNTDHDGDTTGFYARTDGTDEDFVGEDHEGAVSGLLWNLESDRNSDQGYDADGDGVPDAHMNRLGPGELTTLLKDSDAARLDEFIDYVWPADGTYLVDDQNDLGCLLENEGIGIAPAVAVLSHSATSAPPELNWEAGNFGDFKNDEFIVDAFVNGEEEPVFSSRPIRGLSWTPTHGRWRQLIQGTTTLHFRVTGTQTAAPATGRFPGCLHSTSTYPVPESSLPSDTASVTTLAGSGASGLSDGVGAAASFTAPVGMSIADGHAYTIDSGYVRKISLATGAVSKVAGNGTVNGTCIDNLDPSEAQLSKSDVFSSQVANDGTYLYWADPCSNNTQTIRRMSLSTGAVSTVRDPQGNSVWGHAIAVAPNGDVYASSNSEIRKIEAGTGTQTVFATLPTVPLYGRERTSTIRGMTADSGHLWIVSSFTLSGYEYGTVSKVSLSTAAVTTVHAPTDANASAPSGTIVGSGDSLYIATKANRVLQMSKTTGEYTSVAGAAAGFADGVGANAWFDTLAGVATDGTNLYVTDRANRRIRMLSPSAPLTAAAPASWTRPLSIASASVSTLAGSGTSGLLDGTGASASFTSPKGMAIAEGFGYTLDSGYIRKVSLTSGEVTTLAGNGTINGSCVDSVNPETAQLSILSNGLVPEITSDGSFLYWPDYCARNNGFIRRMSLSTGAVSSVSRATPAQTVTVGPDGRLFTSVGNNIYTVNQLTGERTLAATLPPLNVGGRERSPEVTGMTADLDHLWVTAKLPGGYNRYAYGAVAYIDVASVGDATGEPTGEVTFVHIQSNPSLTAPWGTLVSTADYLYLATHSGVGQQSDEVLRISKDDGSVTGIAGDAAGFADGSGSSAQFRDLAGIDTDGLHLFVTDTSNMRIRQLD